jgi:superfamily II DNA helicase RecQ
MQGLAIVVTPLLALAMDQMDYLLAHGIQAVRFDSTVTWENRCSIAEALQEPDTNVKALFATPETLCHSQLLIKSLNRAALCGNVSFVVVDEAHCVDMWTEFR